MPLWDRLRSKLTSGQVRGPAVCWWSCPTQEFSAQGCRPQRRSGARNHLNMSLRRPSTSKQVAWCGWSLPSGHSGCGRVCLATISEKTGSEVERGSCPAPGPRPSSSADCVLLAPWGGDLVPVLHNLPSEAREAGARAIVVGVFEGYGGTRISPGTERIFSLPLNFYSRIFQLCLNYFFLKKIPTVYHDS